MCEHVPVILGLMYASMSQEFELQRSYVPMQMTQKIMLGARELGIHKR